MIKRHLLLGLAPALLIMLLPSFAGAQIAESDVTPLSNHDVMFMVTQQLEPEIIIKIINTSPCTFDTFPSVIREMRRRGVPQTVLQAMVAAPYGPSLVSSTADDLGELPIYHYAEQLKQLGFLNPIAGRRMPAARRRARTSRSRQRQ